MNEVRNFHKILRKMENVRTIWPFVRGKIKKSSMFSSMFCHIDHDLNLYWDLNGLIECILFYCFIRVRVWWAPVSREGLERAFGGKGLERAFGGKGLTTSRILLVDSHRFPDPPNRQNFTIFCWFFVFFRENKLFLQFLLFYYFNMFLQKHKTGFRNDTCTQNKKYLQ